jgi:hypothetical protein
MISWWGDVGEVIRHPCLVHSPGSTNATAIGWTAQVLAAAIRAQA